MRPYAGVVDGLGQELSGLGDQARQGVQPDGGVAEPVRGAEPDEVLDRFGEDVAGCGRRWRARAAARDG
ncbi:MAG: hypothetical protein ABSA53_15710 [Streptosporangiaceae bacterium]